MDKTIAYREILRLRPPSTWEDYLCSESGLPGARANLELLHAAADLVNEAQMEAWLALDPWAAPENTPFVFLTCCGTLALGRRLAERQLEVMPRLRELANDPRWRVREAVAMALQRLGDASMDALVEAVRPWAMGTLLEQRAVAAGLCEPRLLVNPNPQYALAALDLLHQITQNLHAASDRKQEAFRVLRKGLAYAWSVAIAALPEAGKKCFEAWVTCSDKDIRWMVRENLKKNRLIRMDPAWVEAMTRQLSSN